MQICKSAGSPPVPEVRRIVDSKSFLDWHLLNKIKKAARLLQEVAAYEPQIKEVKDAIIAAALDNGDLSEEGSVTYIVDGILCRVSSGYDYRIPAESQEALKTFLGKEYDDLVETVVELRPSQRLIEMACDGDLSPDLRKHLSIRLRAPQVSILQESGEKGVGR